MNIWSCFLLTSPYGLYKYNALALLTLNDFFIEHSVAKECVW